MKLNDMRLNLTTVERRVFDRLITPQKIQDYLNRLPMNSSEYRRDTHRSPRDVLRAKRAHCIEGAFFAAAVLWHHGHRPLLMDLRAVGHDYDHTVALFRHNGLWGAISKTSHSVLRYRDPIYRSLRELALSYFHEYFLDDGSKTLREFSKPFDLARFGTKWVTTSDDLWYLVKKLDASPHERLFPRGTERILRCAEPIERDASGLKEW